MVASTQLELVRVGMIDSAQQVGRPRRRITWSMPSGVHVHARLHRRIRLSPHGLQNPRLPIDPCFVNRQATSVTWDGHPFVCTCPFIV